MKKILAPPLDVERLAVIEAARRQVASATPDLNTIAARAARQEAAFANVPRWR
jgi:hypothetical protein